MKKLLVLGILCLSFFLVACGGGSKKSNPADTDVTDTDVTDTDVTDTDVTDTDVTDTDPADTGDTDPADTGDTDPADTGDTDPADTGDTDPADTGDTDPADTGDTDPADTANTGDTDPADTGDTADTGDIECTGLSLDWSNLILFTNSNYVFLTNDDNDPQLFMSHFESGVAGHFKVGTFDLGSEINSNFELCEECVDLYSDFIDSTQPPKAYFQKSGTLTIDAVDATGNIKGSISAVLAEITTDPETYETIFIANGGCFEIESASFDTGVVEE